VFGLLKTINDHDIRLFVVLNWMYRERSMREAIEREYDQKGIFGKDDINHFHSFVGLIGKFVDQTVQFPYDPSNVMDIVENFIKAAKLEYMMGPY
jgi:hypothetical protein